MSKGISKGISNIQQEISNVQVGVGLSHSHWHLGNEYQQIPSAELTWTLEISCWILDILADTPAAPPNIQTFLARNSAQSNTSPIRW